jgi:hypothetical protein
LSTGGSTSAGACRTHYLGAETGTKLRVEDRNGNRLFEDDQDPGVWLGVSLVGRF